MKMRASIACLSCLFFGVGNGVVWGGERADSVVAQNDQSADKELLFFMEEQDLVSATKRPITLRKAPAIATVISADDIREMGARNLADVLKMVPGFGVSINEIGLQMIEVRGVRSFVSEKILVMIDGHSMNKNITGSAFFDSADRFPIENIRQVEIIRGPGSALYGNSAFVATINIITRSAQEINGLEVKGGGGSFDSFQGSLVGGKAFGDKLTVSGNLGHQQTNGPRLTVGADALSATPFSLAPGAPDLGFRQTDAFLKVGYGDFSFRGGYKTERQASFLGFGPAITDNNYTDHDSYWGEMAYGLRLAQGVTSNAKLYYDHFEQNPNVKILPDGFPGFPGGMIGQPFAKDRTIGGELQFDWEAFTGNHLIAGFSFEDLRQYDVRQLANFDPATGAPIGSLQGVANWNKDASRQIFATYLQDEWQLPAQVNITAGVRYDHYSDFGDTVNPRVGVVWSFLENADLKLLYGQAFRAPNFQELYNINNPAQLGNPALKPEQIETYEAGLAWRLNRFIAANANYFYSSITNQIDVNPTATPAPTYANIGKSKIQGVELGANGSPASKLRWQLSYAYQDPREADTDKRLPYVPSQRASASANYAASKYLNLHGDLLWTGPRPRPQGDVRPDAPSYATVDLAVTLKNFFKTLEVQATAHNLFDRHYSDPDTSGANHLVPGDFPREGISGFVTAKYKF